jgi:hypothetical protein
MVVLMASTLPMMALGYYGTRNGMLTRSIPFLVIFISSFLIAPAYFVVSLFLARGYGIREGKVRLYRDMRYGNACRVQLGKSALWVHPFFGGAPEIAGTGRDSQGGYVLLGKLKLKVYARKEEMENAIEKLSARN